MGDSSEKTFRQPPPRSLNAYTQMTILLGGFFQQFGWAFLGFGMIFVLAFSPFEAWKYALVPGPWDEVKGTVIATDPTNTSINENTVFKHGFLYVYQATEYTGICYSLNSYAPGASVPVKVNVRKPERSKIAGSQTAAAPRFASFVLIFPLVGLIMLVPGVRQQAKTLDLLRYGEFTRGVITNKEATGTVISINNVSYPVMKYTFRFSHGGREYDAVCKTHITQPLEDEERESILYYPDDPKFNAVYDGIYGAPQMDSMGYYIPADWRKAWVFLAPALSIALVATEVMRHM
jgi:hypothetical protein